MSVATRPFGAIAGPVPPAIPRLPFNGVMLIGEAPGQTEAILKRPFCGPAGDLFDKVLAEAGCDRRAAIVANVFRWQPSWSATAEGKRRNNDISSFFVDDGPDAVLDMATYHGKHLHASHLPDIEFLKDLIRRSSPKRIVVMGSIALWALTSEDRIKANRGKILTTPMCDAPVFPTFHPAYALHRRDDAITDLIRLDITRAIEP